METAPTLEGDRIRLEPIDARLATAMVAGRPDPEMRWEDGFPMEPILNYARAIAGATPPAGPFTAFAIIRADDGAAVGDAGFHGPPAEDGVVEIGYALVPSARGAGLGREAVGLLVGWARRRPEVAAIMARVEPGNEASERILDGLGFQREGDRGG